MMHDFSMHPYARNRSLQLDDKLSGGSIGIQTNVNSESIEDLINGINVYCVYFSMIWVQVNSAHEQTAFV